MEIKNKFEKFLMTISSVFLLATIVLGFKVESDSKKINQALENLNADPGNSNAVISQTREKILSQAAQAPAQNVTQDVVKKTVVPGKVVKQTVPVTSTAKTTTTKKTTKTS